MLPSKTLFFFLIIFLLNSCETLNIENDYAEKKGKIELSKELEDDIVSTIANLKQSILSKPKEPFIIKTVLSDSNKTKMSIIDGLICFELPDGFNSMAVESSELIEMQNGRYKLCIFISDISSLYDQKRNNLSLPIQELLEINKNVTTEDLTQLYNSGATYVFAPYSPAKDFKSSWRLVVKNGLPIGEMNFSLSSSNNLRTGDNYVYSLCLFVANKMVRIDFIIRDEPEYDMARSMAEYCIEKDGNMYWKDLNAVNAFFMCLDGDSYMTLPMEMQYFRSGWDIIINTLEIKV
jgi:hypothetical protein